MPTCIEIYRNRDKKLYDNKVGYKGDIGLITYNQDSYDVLIPKGTRLAQCVVMEVPKVELIEVFELSESQRGDTGFGSSGTK